MRRLLCAAVSIVAGCGSSKMVKATNAFSTLTTISTTQLGGTSSMVEELCRARAEIAFLRAAKSGHGDFHSALTRVIQPARPGEPTTSWWWICSQYELADGGFQHGLASIHAYADALASIAAGNDDARRSELEGLAATEAADAAALSSNVGKIKTTLEGVAKPVGELAGLVLAYWRSDKIRSLILHTDEPLHDLVCHLSMFLDTVRRELLWQARQELAELVKQLESEASPYAAATVEVEVTHRMDRLEARLSAMTDVLAQLARAHRELRIGWEADEPDVVDTVRTIGVIAKDVYQTVTLVQNPSL